MCVQLHHVEKIARMLPVHRGDKFAAVEILGRYNWGFKVGL